MSNENQNQVIEEIRQERLRQPKIGWDSDHDDSDNTSGQLTEAAACYAMSEPIFIMRRHRKGLVSFMSPWPWTAENWKMSKPRRRQLIIAAALIVAEIERLDRADASEPPPKPEDD